MDATPPDNPQLQELLAEGQRLVYQARDERFEALGDWGNKASWLSLVGSILILVLGILEGHVELFIAGAAGGLLSRMMRAIGQVEFAVDYGASWSTLLLSPLFGALSAWFGIGVVALLADPGVAVLGGLFKLVQWEEPLLLSTLTVAFLLGFSERFFDSLTKAATATSAKSPQSSSSLQDQTGNNP